MAKLPTCQEYFALCVDAALTDLRETAEWVKSLIGTGLTWLALSILGQNTKAPETLGGQWTYELGALAASGLLVFVLRLAFAPIIIARRDASKIRALEREIAFLRATPSPDITLTVDGGVAVDVYEGDSTEAMKCGFLVHVRNVGSKTMRNCQLFWVSHPPLSYPQETRISEPFDLKPKESRPFPTIYVEDGAKSSGDPYVIPYDSPILGLMVPTGEHEIRLLADDNHGASIKVMLDEDDDMSKSPSVRWSLKPTA